MPRPKGAENKENKAIKDMIRAALNKKGGSAYFEKQADLNPTAFMTLIGKLIPAEVNIGGQEDNPIKTSLPEQDRAILEHYYKTKGIKNA